MSRSERYALSELAWRAARVRNLDAREAEKLVAGALEGGVTLDATAVAAEVEAYITTLRPLHPACQEWVRKYGYAAYHYRNTPDTLNHALCQGCARPLACTNPNGAHSYQEISRDEARKRGIYHAGRCYHVEVCTGCGDVHPYDSSD